MFTQFLSHFTLIIAANLVTQSNCTDGDVRLVDGSNKYEGRVEVCVNQAWGTVCAFSWSSNDARVVCNQIGAVDLGIIVINLYAYCTHIIFCRQWIW